jgi:CheY-like chemotaxis protein
MTSSSSLLQPAPMKRISSGSSLATGDGGGLLGSTSLLDNSSRKLLIAEDNAINMKVALGILRRLGFTNVVTAPDGVAAVEAVAAAGGPAAFDAILMDLHMPKKGGIEAVQDILRAWPHQRTKIIAVTADAFEDTRDSCVAVGFTGWLAKPFRVEEFARIMGQES